MKSSILINILAYFVKLVVSENKTCCLPGYFIKQNAVVREKYVCWEPTSNRTEELQIVCENVSFVGEKQYTLSLNEAGQLKAQSKMNPKVPPVFIDKDQFCFGTRRRNTKNNTMEIPGVAACYNKQLPPVVDRRIKSYCSIVSVVFLVLTAIVYAAMPELRDLQGRSIFNFCFSLAIGLGIQAYMQLASYRDMNLCAARGFLVYFFIIAAFFWMNAISIQILKGMRRPSCQFEWIEFVWYAVYAWGCPVILTVSMAIVNYVEGDHMRPGIGLNHCWFFNSTQQWIYMYSVMTILITVNIGIFVYVSATLWRLTFSSNNIKALRYKFTLMLRLFMVMGLPWIFEMVSSLATPHIFWAIVDIFNLLVGLMIFLLLVVFRRRTLKALHRHGWLCCCSGYAERHLTKADDLEDNIVQHTIVPMNTVVET